MTSNGKEKETRKQRHTIREQLFPNKKATTQASNKQTKLRKHSSRQNKHSDGPRQRDYNLQEANCNNYSQIGLGMEYNKTKTL